MRKLTRKDAPFFSLLDQKDVIYKPYRRQRLEALYTFLLLNARNKGGLHTIIPWLLAPLLFFPAYLAFSFLAFTSAFTFLGAVIGIAAIAWGAGQISNYRRIKSQLDFIEDLKNEAPPDLSHPMFKSNTLTFNQCYSFVVHNNFVWFALRRSPFESPDWCPFYIENFPKEGIERIELRADVQNLMAKVTTKENTFIYYKKVMEDERKDGKYIINDVSGSPYSYNQWFTLPIVDWISLRQWHQRLALKPNALWSMSHSGALRHHIYDQNQRPHPIWGVTTLYELEGTEIVLPDPYVPMKTEIRISIPPDLQVLDMEATSSRLFILGRSISEPFKKQLFTATLDYDVLGLNPLMRYTHDASKAHRRYLPITKGWRQIDLPKKVKVGNALCVIQTGEHDNVELRVETIQKGRLGFYYQNLGAKTWKLDIDNHMTDVLRPHISSHLNKQPYYAKDVQFLNTQFYEVSIEHFDIHCINAKIKMKHSSEDSITLFLQKRARMVRAFMKEQPDYPWVLSLSKESQTPKNKAWFHGVSMDVECHEGENHLSIIGAKFILLLHKTENMVAINSFVPKFRSKEISTDAETCQITDHPTRDLIRPNG